MSSEKPSARKTWTIWGGVGLALVTLVTLLWKDVVAPLIVEEVKGRVRREPAPEPTHAPPAPVLATPASAPTPATIERIAPGKTIDDRKGIPLDDD